ncbi:RNA-binding S4 domain-containing protein [Nocardioides cavernaquae]|uniref:RNA-binding S4 domain-containing protein n=1 Tax=Nocardioides cavernaquae TaxID=2321396 RepID=A0A3A5H873_9ACTN|nr:RNA-binding S4 domain-containing protein [Nocardioides cavernaquae]
MSLFKRGGLKRGGASPQEPQGPVPVDVPVRDEMIRLGQFLKLANLIETGAEAKEVCPAGLVKVNGEVDVRRGRQLHHGDVVELRGMAARVAEDTFGAPDGLPW